MRRANMILQKKAGGGLIAGSQIATGILDSLDKPDEFGAKSNSGAAISGLLSGASAGAALGPYGIAAGSVLGGITSLLGNKKAIQERDRANQKRVSDAEMNRQNLVDSRLITDPSLKNGNRNASLLKFGGTLKGTNSGKFSIGKVNSPIAGVVPDLLPDVSIRAGALASKAKGGIIPTSSRTGLVVGPSHAEGGVKFPSRGVELEGKETTTADGFVFSNELGFSKAHNKIGKAMGKNERRPDTPDKIHTQEAMVRQEGFLKLAQEATKKRMGLPNEIDNSAEKMRKQIGTQMLAKGGYMKLGGQDPRIKKLNAQRDKSTSDDEKANLDNTILSIRQLSKIPKNKPLPIPNSLYNFDSKLPQFLGSDGSNLKNLTLPKTTKAVATPTKKVLPATAPEKIVTTTITSKAVPAPVGKANVSKPVAPAPPPKPVIGKVFKNDKKKSKTVTTPPLSQELQSSLKAITDFNNKPATAIETLKTNPDRLKIKSGLKTPTINPIKVDVPKGPSKFSKAIRNLGFDVKDTLSKADGALEKIAPFASNIANAFRRLPQPPKQIMDDTLTPGLVNYDADRVEAVKQRRGADKAAEANLGTGAAISATKAANLAGQIGAVNKINQEESNVNTGIKNQFAQLNANIKANNNNKRTLENTQQVERQIKQQELDAENIANVGDKMQAIQRDKAAANLDDDRMILTMASANNSAALRAGDAILKRRLSPEGYKQMIAIRDRLDTAEAEDLKLLQAQARSILSSATSDTKTILADGKFKKGLLSNEYTEKKIETKK